MSTSVWDWIFAAIAFFLAGVVVFTDHQLSEGFIAFAVADTGVSRLFREWRRAKADLVLRDMR